MPHSSNTILLDSALEDSALSDDRSRQDFQARVARHLQLDLIKYMNAQTPAIVIAQIGLWVVNATVLSQDLSVITIVIMTCAMLLYCVGRIGYYYYVEHTGEENIDYTKWLRIHTTAGVYAGLFWASVAIYVIHTLNFEAAAFLLFSIFGLVGGSVAIISVVMRLLFCFTLTAMVPTACFMLMQDTQQYTMYAFVFLFVSLITYPLASRYQSLFAETSRSRFEVDQLMKRLQRANHTKAEFLANMSHELRSPLSVMLGYVQMMRQRSEENTHQLSKKQMESLSIVEKSGKQIADFVSDILELSVAEASEQRQELTRLDFPTMLYELETSFTQAATNKGLNIEINLDESVPTEFIGDRTRLRQVLMNLIDNAVKFTQTGTVKIDARLVTPRNSNNTNDNALSLRVGVTDTGPGIAQSELDLLFVPFSQTTTGRKKRQGTGLGLALSQKYVEAMGSKIQVNSRVSTEQNPDSGTEFYFVIAIDPVAPRQEQAGFIEHEWTLARPCRALVVDDDEKQRELFAAYLSDWSFDVRTADGGAQGIEAFDEFCPDIALLDLRMPDIDGEQVVKHIRQHERTAQVNTASDFQSIQPCRVIAVSAHGRRADNRRLSFLGFNAFLTKPFNREELLEAIHSLMPELLAKNSSNAINIG